MIILLPLHTVNQKLFNRTMETFRHFFRQLDFLRKDVYYYES